MSNLQFLTFFINTIKAVHDHESLLRGRNCGNDHRLGQMKRHRQLSLYLLGQLTKVLAELEGVTAGK
jgi:glutamine synthetase